MADILDEKEGVHITGHVDHAEMVPGQSLSDRLERFPWWLVIILALIALMGLQLLFNREFYAAFQAIAPGLSLTLYITVVAFLAALLLGLLAGLGRIANNAFVRTIATTYIEFIRGVPILVLIFTVAFVIVPMASEVFGFSNRSVSFEARAMVALALIYGAFMAEIFRAGIESIPRGQMEAARSLGMSHYQAMRYIILPQAIRNVLPALGNDFIAMLKDSSLVSVLGVREITQQARLYAASTFRYEATYLVLTFMYLSMTVVLSLLLQWYQRKLGKNV